jgi:hypothetical protein
MSEIFYLKIVILSLNSARAISNLYFIPFIFIQLFILKTEYKDINYGNLNIFMKWEEFKNFFIELNDKNLIEKKGMNYTISNKSRHKLTLHSMKDDFIDSFNDENLN